MGRDPETTSKIMSSIKSEDTKPEKLLGSAMWGIGLRYRKNYKEVEGNPDFAFPNVKLAVFCDGDFWHGNNWRLRGYDSFEDELDEYSEYWQKKLTRNVIRDKEVNQTLEEEGWTVLRFWESDIKENVDECAKEVYKVYKKLKTN